MQDVETNVRLDISMKKTSVCSLDECGKIVHEATVFTDPHNLQMLSRKPV